MTELYDSSGNRIGSVNGGGGDGFILAFICAIGFLIYHLFVQAWGKVTNWYTFELPYNYIAAFYNYIVVIPIKLGVDISHWFDVQEFTKYPNLNTTITVLGVLVYICSIIFIISRSTRILEYLGYEAKTLWIIFFAPSILGGAWFLLVELFNWIFSTV
jgi:hypothetical protein